MQLSSAANRMLHNDTPYEVKVELYLRDKQQLDRCRGTRYVYLQPYQAQDVEVGDFRNANLNGIKLIFEIDGEQVIHTQMITSSSSSLENILNQHVNIRISSLSPVTITGFDD